MNGGPTISPKDVTFEGRVVRNLIPPELMSHSDAMKRKTILVLSDAHIGGEISNFYAYQEHLLDLMARHDHVVLNGDDWELFYLDRDHVDKLSGMLETLTGKSVKYWRKEFDLNDSARSGVKNVIEGAKWFVREFLERNPRVHLHVVGGNHESVRRFHNEFEELQKRHPGSFEWSPQAIRIHDALFTHAHLQMSGKTVDEFPRARLRNAEQAKKWAKLLAFFAKPDHAFHLWARSPAKASLRMGRQLAEWNGQAKFFASRDGVHEPLEMESIRHVFFGHTHVKFDNLEGRGGALYHNTGAIVKETSRHPEDLGVLAADLDPEGGVSHVRPVPVGRDRDARSRPRPAAAAPGASRLTVR